MQHNDAEVRRAITERLAALSLDESLREEIAQHLQQRYDELRAGEASPAEALRETLAELDDERGLLELARETRRAAGPEPIVLAIEPGRLAWVSAFVTDLRLATRLIRRSPGFAAVSVLTLALGIGANTAVFSLLDAVLLRPLPFPEPDRLVRLDATKDGRPIFDPSALDVRDYDRASRTFERLVAYSVAGKSVSLLRDTLPQQMPVGMAPEGYFAVLRIRPILGRLFTEEENAFGKHFVAMITRSLWESRFGADPAILGRTLRINDEAYVIVGVLPEATPEWLEVPPARIDVWTPFMVFPNMWQETARGDRGYRAIGRMKPGVTIDEAQADLSRIAADLERQYTADHGFGVRVRRLADTRADTMTTSIRPVLLMLMGAVTLVLLIACANAANLLLARQAVRGREMAVRAALGASRTALVRQLLAEMLVLSFAGGALGIGIAWLGTRTLAALHSFDAPQFGVGGIDVRVLIFTLIVSVLTGLLFGLAPALTGSRVNLIDTLREGGRTGAAGGGVRQRVRRVLVAGEIALALMLAIGAALLAQSIIRLQRQDLGFRADHLLTVHFFLPPTRYSDPDSRTRFTDAFIARVTALPGVRDASVTMVYPPVNRYTITFMFVDRPVHRVEDLRFVTWGITDAHYMRTLGIPIRRGRDFADTDTAVSAPVALVNETFVRRFLPNEEPLGKQVAIDRPEGLVTRPAGRPATTIVGVVADTRSRGMAQTDGPQIYWLWRQHPTVNYGFKDVVIRTVDDPYALTTSIREQLAALDPTLPLTGVKSMDDLLKEQVADRRFTTFLLGVFAVLGVALAMVGVYGVISYLVAQRTAEIGVRVALGASRGVVLWLVVRQGLTTGITGVVVGLIGAWTMRQTLAKLVFSISTLDATTYLLGALLLLLVTGLASAIPARRALRVDPVSALRCD